MDTIGASTMSIVFSALGRLTPALTGVSPDALNVMSRNTTVTTRKSIMLVSDRAAFTPRPPPPETRFSTNFKPTWCINRRPGSTTGIACSPSCGRRCGNAATPSRPFADTSIDREGHVEGRHTFRLSAGRIGAVGLVHCVDHADDRPVGGFVIRVQDGLIELFVARIAVGTHRLPFRLDLGGEVGKAHDFHVPLLVDHVLAGHVEGADHRPGLLPNEDELVRRPHLDVELLLRFDLLHLGVGSRRSGDLSVCVETRHMTPDGRDEEEGDRDHQVFVHRGNVDLGIERPASALTAAVCTYATHRSCSALVDGGEK